MHPNLPSPASSSSLAAAAGLLLLLVLLALLHWGGGLGEGGARDHEALAGLVRHRMGFLGCRVALRVGGDHEARGQGLTWCEPLSLGVVQAAHSRHVRCRHARIRVASRHGVGRRCVGHRHAGVLLNRVRGHCIGRHGRVHRRRCCRIRRVGRHGRVHGLGWD